jgi:hypothetical protein
MGNLLVPNAQQEGMVELGTYSFTAVTSIALPNNLFSTAYDNYFIQLNCAQNTTASNMYFRFRSAGSDITTSYYYGGQGWSSAGAAINRAGVNGGGVYFTGATTIKADGANNSFNISIYQPLTGSRKNFIYDSTYWNSSDVQNSLRGGGFCSAGSVGDSLSFATDSGTITGTAYVYGMRK